MSGASGRRWWRRNWWGLVAVVPLLVGVVVVSPSGAFQALRDHFLAEEDVIRPGADGWVSYAGVRLRLAEFGPADLFDDDGEPFRVPGLAAWQATLVIEPAGDPDALIGCALELEDAAGRRYQDGPAAIGSASDDTGSGVYASGCSPPFDAPDDGATPFETIGYFLLPESISPEAVRLSHFEGDPDYVRLDVG